MDTVEDKTEMVYSSNTDKTEMVYSSDTHDTINDILI